MFTTNSLTTTYNLIQHIACKQFNLEVQVVGDAIRNDPPFQQLLQTRGDSCGCRNGPKGLSFFCLPSNRPCTCEGCTTSSYQGSFLRALTFETPPPQRSFGLFVEIRLEIIKILDDL